MTDNGHRVRRRRSRVAALGRRRSRVTALAAPTLLAMTLATPASSAADATSNGRPAVIGPQCAAQALSNPVTDVNSQAGNGRTTVGINAAGTITVFKWPNPSFYNQVKYYTSGHDTSGDPVGALPNEGSFAGILYDAGGTTGFAWLREWPHTQTYASPSSATVVTTYSDPALGLSVTDTDLVAAPPSATFIRSFAVTRAAGSPVSAAALVYYEKFSPIASKIPYAPGQDNCLQQLNDQQVASYDGSSEAIVHSWTGVDASTGRPSSVAAAFGWDTPASSHEVGRDDYEPLAPKVGPADAYDQLQSPSHTLGNAGFEAGQATGALETRLRFDAHGDAQARMIISPASTPAAALADLRTARAATFSDQQQAAEDWMSSWLSTAALPRTTDHDVLDADLRALISIRLATDPDTGAIVASADIESPYGEDWIRDASFINHALDVAGYTGMVTRHDLFEASVQSQPGRLDPGAPVGNWPMNVYGDGIPGGPIPYEIDETGLGAWTLWDHAQFLPARARAGYLRQVYPAIARAAGWLTVCADPTNGLQCRADEDDSFPPSQSLHGAGPALLGLRSASSAAAALGDHGPEPVAWASRAATLQAAIDKLYDPLHGAYRETAGASSALPVSYGDGGWLLWPVHLHSYSDPRMQGEAAATWQAMETSLDGSSGGYEGKALLGTCEAGSPLSPAKKQSMNNVLHFMATSFTTSTGLFGEWWGRFDGADRPLNDMPHVWEGALFYLSSMCVDG